MDFDSDGVLWYVVTSLNNYEENLESRIPAGLFRWDITRGGKPEFMGAAGTPKRVCGWNSEVVCTKGRYPLYHRQQPFSGRAGAYRH